jgi:hypothetical protein
MEDRRQSVRHAAVNRVAKLRLGSGREELCQLRDISAEGMRAEVYLALQPGTPIQIELLTAHVAAGHVRWAAKNEIGVAFNEPIPAAAMLAHCSFEDNAANSRPPRLRVDLRGLFRLGAEAKVVSIGNISQAGVQIAAPTPLRIGTACSIALPRLPARAAAICWWREGHAGLMLNEPFDYPTFAQWRASFP